MKNKLTSLETYSYSFYSHGAEPMLDSIRLERGICGPRVPEYRSDYVQLIFFTGGTGTLRVNGQEYQVCAGQLTKLFPYHIAAIEATPGTELSFFKCWFSLSVLMYLDVKKDLKDATYSVVESGNYLVSLSSTDSDRVMRAFQEIELECAERRPHYLSAVLGNLLCALSVFDRETASLYAQSGPIERSLAWRALQHMHMHFNLEGMDAASIGAKFDITPIQLGHLLRRLTGQGFTANLHDVRIRNACAMMYFEELSISFIARYVGYSSLATFQRAFKKMKGVTPGQHRAGVVGDVSTGAHRDTAWKVLVYMMEHFTENVRLSTTADQLFIGEDTLAHICEKNFGATFMELLCQVRLGYACAMLSLAHLNINDIVLAVGYNSTRTFSQHFKEHLGTTPQRYRESLAGNSKR